MKIYSVGHTENHKLISVIMPEGDNGVKLYQTVLDKYIGKVCTVQKSFRSFNNAISVPERKCSANYWL